MSPTADNAPSFDELQRRMAMRAKASPRFQELLSSPPKLDFIETDGPRLMAIARSPPLAKRWLEPEPEPELQQSKLGMTGGRLPSTVGGVLSPAPETVRLMDLRFEERLLCSNLSRASGMLPPDQFWDTLCVASRASRRPESAAANQARLQRIAEVTVARPSTGATRDEFGVAMHLAEHSGKASSITPASVASLRRIWQLHRKMAETQSELDVLRAELDTPPVPATVAVQETTASTPQTRRHLEIAPATVELDQDQDWLEAGMSALQSGDYADAARSFSRALRADPDSASALRGLHEATKGVELSSMSPSQIEELAQKGYAGDTALGQALGFDTKLDSPSRGSRPVMQTPSSKQPYGDVAAASPAVTAIQQQTRRERLLRRGAVAVAAAEKKNQRFLEKATRTVKRQVAATARSRLPSSSNSSYGEPSETPERKHV